MASCFDFIASCFDFIASCFDLMTSCFDLMASCFDVMASCFDLIASCSNLNSSCLDFRAICRMGKKGHIHCFTSEHVCTDSVVLELVKVPVPDYAGHLGSRRYNHTCAFPTKSLATNLQSCKDLHFFTVAHLTSPLLPRL